MTCFSNANFIFVFSKTVYLFGGLVLFGRPGSLLEQQLLGVVLVPVLVAVLAAAVEQQISERLDAADATLDRHGLLGPHHAAGRTGWTAVGVTVGPERRRHYFNVKEDLSVGPKC